VYIAHVQNYTIIITKYLGKCLQCASCSRMWI